LENQKKYPASHGREKTPDFIELSNGLQEEILRECKIHFALPVQNKFCTPDLFPKSNGAISRRGAPG